MGWRQASGPATRQDLKTQNTSTITLERCRPPATLQVHSAPLDFRGGAGNGSRGEGARFLRLEPSLLDVARAPHTRALGVNGLCAWLRWKAAASRAQVGVDGGSRRGSRRTVGLSGRTER